VVAVVGWRAVVAAVTSWLPWKRSCSRLFQPRSQSWAVGARPAAEYWATHGAAGGRTLPLATVDITGGINWSPRQ